MKQFLITPAAGKSLIAKALAEHKIMKNVLEYGTLVIIAGTTNGYIAEEILSKIGQIKDFSRRRFFRGVVLPPGGLVPPSGRLKDESGFPGDVVIKNGVWQKGLTIFDVVDDLKEGDIVLKGANALNYQKKQAAIYIGDPYGGTIGATIQAVVGRRVRLILPVGMEKRVYGDLNDVAQRINSPESQGPRLLPVPGEIFTEIEAIYILTGAKAELIAGGGIAGAEGSVWMGIEGEDKELEAAETLIKSISSEKSFEF